MQRLRGLPSPSMAVAVTALVFGMGGVGIAQTDVFGKLTGKKVRTIAKSEINKAAPGLTVLKAKAADSAATATNAQNATNSSQLDGQAAAAFATKAGNEAVHLVGAAGEPAFQNGYTNYGGGFAPAGFYRDQFGAVHFQGMLDDGNDNAPAFTLPVGYRPSTQHYQLVATGPTNGETATVRIDSNGDVILQSTPTTFISLENIEFVVGT